MDKLYIYTRVSTRGQLDGYSIDNQIESGEDTAKKNNLAPIVYNEGAESSKYDDLENRPVLQQLVQEVLEGKVKNIYVYEFSRLSRSPILSANLQKIFIDNEITLFEGKGIKYNLNDPNQEFTLAILNQVSQLENKIKLKRISNNIIKGIEAGRMQGKYVPFGYKRDEQRKLVVDDEEAKIVKNIFESYLEGKGCKQIANNLNARKVQTRYNKCLTKDITINQRIKSPESFKWTDGVVHKILRQKRYVGIVQYAPKHLKESKPLEFSCTPIIDRQTFDEVQNKLSSNYNKINPVKKFSYLLAKKLICGVCGRNYYGRKRSNLKDNFYTCISSRYSEPCGNKSFNIDLLEKFVWRCLMDSEIVYNQIKKSNTDKDESKIQELEVLISNIQKDVRKLESSIEALTESFIDKMITKDLYQKLLGKRNKELNFIRRELKSYEKDKEILNNQKENFSYLSTFAKKYLFTEDFAIRKKYIDLVVRHVTIYPVKHLDDDLTDMFNNKGVPKGRQMYNKLHKLDNIIYCTIKLYSGETLSLVATNRTRRFFSSTTFMNFDKENYKLSYIQKNNKTKNDGRISYKAP